MTTIDSAEFRQSVLTRNAQSLRVQAVLATVLVPAFWLLDWVVVPDYVFELFFLRLSITLYALFALIAGFRRPQWTENRADQLTITLMWMAAFSIAVMCWLHDGYESPYYAGMILVVIVVGSLSSWPLKLSLIFNIPVYGFYMIPLCLGLLPVKNAGLMLCAQFFLLSTMIITIASQNHRYRLEEREFNASLALQHTTASLEQAYEQLKQLDRLKNQFFSNITHELRTPLTMILSPIETMLDGEAGQLSDHQQKLLDSVSGNALKLLRLINDLLDLAKLEERFLRLQLKKTNVAKILETMTEYSKPLAARKEIAINININGEIPAVYIDPEKMERVFVNLLSNALKFTVSGGRVGVSIEAGENEVRVAFSDTGIGIEKDKLETIFQRFSQADASVTRRYGGTGIGLAFAQEIVDLHNGSLSVESEINKGSTFTVGLKLGLDHFDPKRIDRRTARVTDANRIRRAEDREPVEWTQQLVNREDYRFLDIGAATERRVAERGTDDPRASRILVVEDTVEVLKFIHLQLSSEHTVFLAQDGRSGLELARKQLPDIVVTDYMMPEMDGLSLTKALKSDELTAHIPVVMLTAKARAEDRVSAREGGADVYLQKPFSPKELRAVINQLLKRRGRQISDLAKTQTRSLETICAGLSHELKNPLSYIKNAHVVIDEKAKALIRIAEANCPNQLVKIAKLRGRIDQMAAVAARGIARIDQVVDLVRRYAREGYPTEPSDVAFDRALADVMELVTPSGSENQLEAHLDCADATVKIIPEELHQAVRNLIQNALEAVGDEGIVKIHSRLVGDDVLLEVVDNGPGISPDQVERIFTPFYTTKGPGKGMGIGLSISHKTIMDAGGHLTVESAPGQGATFRVTLPRSTHTLHDDISLGSLSATVGPTQGHQPA